MTTAVMTTDEMIAVLQAHKDGKQIQRKSSDGVWRDYPYTASFYPNFDACVYRVKPEPREWFIGNWVDLSASGYSGNLLRVAYTKEQADARISGRHNALIHVREVLE